MLYQNIGLNKGKRGSVILIGGICGAVGFICIIGVIGSMFEFV